MKTTRQVVLSGIVSLVLIAGGMVLLGGGLVAGITLVSALGM